MHVHVFVDAWPPLPPPPPRPAGTRSVWGLMAVLCGVLFLDGLDVSMVGMALPSIESDLGLSTSQLQWIVSGYVLGYGGFLLLGGRAADLLGRRRVLLIALAVFTVASALGGIVDDGTLLVVTRFLKGAAAAFTAPAGLSIITTRFAEGPERNRALSIYTATGASGFSLGLVAGGLLTELGWRWTFLLPVPIAARAAGARARASCRATCRRSSRRRAFDIPGRRDPDRRHAAARAHRRRGARAGLGRARDRRRVRARRAPCSPPSSRSSSAPRAARAARDPALRPARAREPRHDDPVRRLRRLPVRDDAVPAGA